jgi:predicted RNase H-like nuclease (RuvC/YqgF family)
MGKRMTQPQQRVALDMILTQSDHGGMSDAAIELHRRQAEDAEKMDKRMCEIEKKVDSLDKKVDTLDKKMDEIKDLVSTRSSFKESLKEVVSNKVFIYLLLVTIASIFGVQVADIGTFLFK